MKRTWSAHGVRTTARSPDPSPPDVWIWRADDAVAPPSFLARSEARCVPVGEVALPVVALAVIAAVERRGGDVHDPLPPSLAHATDARTIADLLCARDRAVGRENPAMAALLCALTRRTADAAVAELVTGPLGVDAGFAIGDGSEPRASATAVGTVLRAWLRLTVGDGEPALTHPTPDALRAAWSAASEVRTPPRDAPADWRGPGVVRNVGAALATGASPLAFGQISSRAAAVADPARRAVAVAVSASPVRRRAALADLVGATLGPPRRSSDPTS
jgi:hypothetical protein